MDLIPPLRIARPRGATASTTLLSPAQRRRVSSIATRVDVRPRDVIFRAGAEADSVFIVGAGVVTAFQDLANGKRHIAAFWFARDVFGLADNGRYVNSTAAVTSGTLHRIPVHALRQVLLDDSYLQFQFLTKITYELRESQRQKLLLIRRDAVGQVAMFFSLLAQQEGKKGDLPDDIAVPMSRSDIASYLGLTLEAVSRATRALVAGGIISIPERRIVRILDRRRFEQIVGKI